MGILAFIVFGFIIGLIARALMPGDQKMGFILTTVLGIVGSFVGGFLTSLVTKHDVMDFHTTGVIGSIIGAIVLLVVMRAASGRRALA